MDRLNEQIDVYIQYKHAHVYVKRYTTKAILQNKQANHTFGDD
jgi:hypothetical protein